jgi:hypothetical protein
MSTVLNMASSLYGQNAATGVFLGVLAAPLTLAAAATRRHAHMVPDQQKRPPAAWRALSEPPIGIEPMTYSLRGRAWPVPREGDKPNSA